MKGRAGDWVRRFERAEEWSDKTRRDNVVVVVVAADAAAAAAVRVRPLTWLVGCLISLKNREEKNNETYRLWWLLQLASTDTYLGRTSFPEFRRTSCTCQIRKRALERKHACLASEEIRLISLKASCFLFSLVRFGSPFGGSILSICEQTFYGCQKVISIRESGWPNNYSRTRKHILRNT